MPKIRLLALLAVLAVLLFPAAALAQPTVCGFYGTAKADGYSASDGTSVTAWIDGAQVAETATSGASYSLKVSGDYTGKTVYFYVGSLAATETATWEAGENKNVNLNAWTSAMPASGEPTIRDRKSVV